MIDQYFNSQFGTAPAQIAHAPGRVNLIGEHTDYNGGMVLPTMLPVGVTVAMRPRTDNIVRIASEMFDQPFEGTLDDAKTGAWADYALGAVIFPRNAGLLRAGADVAIQSTMPAGGGLSSSASLIVAILKAARAHSGTEMTDQDIALLARRVETEFIGVPVGIMDQMAVALAAPGQALALDTKSLSYELIDLPTTHHMAVIHSGQHRQLNDGRYAERKVECDAARNILNVDDICLLTDDALAQAPTMPNMLNARVRHCVTEHRRTVAAAQALKSGDMDALGALMNESHRSMRDDFDMSLPEIDALVADVQRHGAIGARLTGGGFGGCIVACVPKPMLQDMLENVLSGRPQAYFVC